MHLDHAAQILRASILIIFLWPAITPMTLGQTGAASSTQVPAGVTYKTATDEVNASAKAMLIQSLVPDREVSKAFFGSAVTCGPTLWKSIKPSADKVLFESKVVVVLVNSVQTEARGLITDEQRQSFWKTLLNKYPALQTGNIRKANAEEIRYYWATIPFDIAEPFFTIDAGSTKFIVNFQVENGKPKLFWMDLVGDLHALTAEPGQVVDAQTLTVMAEGGDTTSMVQLAKGYWYGTSIPGDIEKARSWLERASGKGSLEAQLFLGMAYFSGTKLPKDRAVAAKYLQLAAGQGSVLAQYFVGMMYRNGEGLEKSNEKAAKYLQLAVDQNHVPAEYDLGVMYQNGEGVPVDSRRGCALFAKAAEQGHAAATNGLGQCYEHGDGVEKNSAKAFELYTKAATAGNLGAQGNLATMYGSSGDWKSSYIWLRIAENTGETQNRPAIDRVKAHLTQTQIDSAEAKILEWQKAHPRKN